MAAAEGGIGFAMPWRRPSPAGQPFWTGKAVNVVDLGDEDGREGGSDSTDLLDHPISAMTGQPVSNHPAEQFDFAVVGVDELQQETDALAVDQIQRRSP